MSKPFGLHGRAMPLGMLAVLQAGFLLFHSWAGELLPPGFRPVPLGAHALVGGRIVLRPGGMLDGGTIIIRDGLIKDVGKDLPAPPDARVWDMKGTTIYAGFIDCWLVLGGTNAAVATVESETVTSATLAAGGSSFYGVGGQGGEAGLRGPGDAIARITPEYQAVKDHAPREKELGPLRELGFTVGVLAPGRGIIRGTSALVSLADAAPNETILKPDVFQHISFDIARGPERAYPASLMGAIACVRQRFFDAQHYAQDRADYLQHPQSRKRPEFNPALEALGPAAARKMRVAFEPGSVLMTHRAALLARELGLDFCLLSSGQEWRRPDLAKATGATFIVPLNFPTLPRLPSDEDWEQVSLDVLRAWDWAPENPAVLRQQGLEIALTTHGLSDKQKFRQNLRSALDRGLSETDALAALTTVPARLCGVDNQLGVIEAGKLANLTVVAGDSYFNPDAKVREVWIDGRVYRSPGEEPKAASALEPKAATVAAQAGEPAPPKGQDKSGKAEQRRETQKTRVAHSPLEGRGVLAAPASVLIRDATIWTCGAKGVLTNAQLSISGGKITAVGYLKTEPGPDTLVIDGSGLHVTPGLIDCHSHSAILGSVNEATLPSSAMVRISDVVNSETGNLYEQLAGGVTTINLLHGSANPIGGQNCVIKLRDGTPPEGLLFEAAPPGIKFALGENVKQSGWGERFVTRFPQTRMGVRTFIANRFTAARQYLAQCEQCRLSGNVPPGRDLELEAIGEILQGKRWIHCHSYRQDEILMLIRLMEQFGVKIGTFQHVLEGYKIADEIARHGAGASSFSDWWAYKFEVYDAIPYNGSLMRERGVLVSFNSDSSELARRLNTEAAKAFKYGGTPEAEALKFVTLNPASQLRIDSCVGSLEQGKDADFALWAKSPLDSETACLQTWIEGKKYFDRTLAAERTARLAKEKRELLDKARKLSKGPSGPEAGAAQDGPDGFFRVSLEHEFDGQVRHCLDQEGE